MALSSPDQRGGSGDPMVLIHGVAGAWRAWHEVAPRLAERFDVLAVALAGHEDAADLPAGVPLTVASMTDAVERDMDAAGFASAHLVGNSLGGWLALELAKRGRARTVVALSPAGGWTAGSREEQRIVRSIRMGHALNRWAAPRARSMMRRPVWKKLMYSQAMAHPERLEPEVAAGAIRAFASARIPEFMENIAGQGGVPAGEPDVAPRVGPLWLPAQQSAAPRPPRSCAGFPETRAGHDFSPQQPSTVRFAG